MIRRLAYLPVALLACLNVMLHTGLTSAGASVVVGAVCGMGACLAADYMDMRDAARRRKAVRP